AAVAADRGAVADLDRARLAARDRERARVLAEELRALAVGHGAERAELDRVAVFLQVTELGLELPDIDERARGDDPVLRLDEDIGAAREQVARRLDAGEHREQLRDAARPLERGAVGDHGPLSRLLEAGSRAPMRELASPRAQRSRASSTASRIFV